MNLIGTNKQLEKTLFDEQDIVMMDTNLLSNNEVDYFHFDFHANCRENSDAMMDFLRSAVLPTHLERMGVFIMYNNIVDERSPDGNVKTRKLVTELERMQNGVIRTNCIDCLDRTNVAQQMICLETLSHLVPEMGS